MFLEHLIFLKKPIQIEKVNKGGQGVSILSITPEFKIRAQKNEQKRLFVLIKNS